VITANWEAGSGNRWTVPLGGGFERVFKVGDQGINSCREAYCNVEHPHGAPEWNPSSRGSFCSPNSIQTMDLMRQAFIVRGTKPATFNHGNFNDFGLID